MKIYSTFGKIDKFFDTVQPVKIRTTLSKKPFNFYVTISKYKYRKPVSRNFQVSLLLFE